jgi:CheY-like chemotaxis protein
MAHICTLSVLVVEDNVDGANSTAMILRNDGYDVSVAYDGTTALERIDAADFDVVLCDIGLPGKNGYEVAAHLRKRRGPCPLLIAVSGYASESSRAAARAAGFDQFLAKPAEPADLETLLRKHAKTRAATERTDQVLVALGKG